jgi:hypothetical protein
MTSQQTFLHFLNTILNLSNSTSCGSVKPNKFISSFSNVQQKIYYLPSFVINDIFLVMAILCHSLCFIPRRFLRRPRIPRREIGKTRFYCTLFYCCRVHTRIKYTASSSLSLWLCFNGKLSHGGDGFCKPAAAVERTGS